MGLFDRFKKKAEEAAEEADFTVEEDSIEAEEALLQRRQLMEAIERAKNPTPSATAWVRTIQGRSRRPVGRFCRRTPRRSIRHPNR